MEIITAIGNYTVSIGDHNHQLSDAVFTVKVDGDLTAEVTVDYASKSVQTKISNIAVLDGFTENVIGIGMGDKDKLPACFQLEVSRISLALSEATKNVVSLIKYYLRHTDISENLYSIRNLLWETPTGDSYPLPSSITVSCSLFSFEPLRENTVQNIQVALDSNIKPLIAMRHLHRALLESIPHHKWIDATIAAELAIKEVLLAHKPVLKPLLLEVPSPPLAKLYGTILEEYFGVRSPYVNEIRKGVEVRNRLIHKPYSDKIDTEKADQYVNIIEKAIFHLLTLIYPEDRLIKNASSR